ncbi:hypothetical protein GOB93_17700 [Acetobacter musti]|uniref:Uncharacterized protein n=1 Tax=Acetobacter musti TaxID=864732 RepID=A0ABX0JY79_9PROT|nr:MULTISPECIES: hypothetical protein [Acetobacter]NHN86454.1 hypothetical protein [Acetobacter musti]NHN93162.1 hypothetical protein [Acetobacter sicerae]
MSTISLPAISAALARLLAETSKPVELVDRKTGNRIAVPAEDAAHPDAYLPVFLVSAEALWLELTGTGFDLDVRPTPASSLGYAVRDVRAGSFTVIMLCLIDVTLRLAEMEDALVLNHLIDFWGEAHGRISDVAPALQGAT